MKQFVILLATLAVVGIASNEAFAQHHHHHRGGGYYGGNYNRGGNSAWAISIGNGYSGFGYSQGFAPGFAAPVYAAPVYAAPVYAAPFYGGYPVYGGSGFNFSYGRGFGGYGRGCGW